MLIVLACVFHWWSCVLQMVGSLTLNSDTELQTGEGEKKYKKKDSLGFKLITQADGDTKVNFFKVLSL